MAIVTNSLSINGRTVISFAGEQQYGSGWVPNIEERPIVLKGDHVTASGVASITYQEIDDETQMITSVTWAPARPYGTAADIIDSYARQLAQRRPA